VEDMINGLKDLRDVTKPVWFLLGMCWGAALGAIVSKVV